MERVWEELREIEKEAEHIHSEAMRKSEAIVAIAREEAEKLVSDSRKHVEEEANELLDQYVGEANRERKGALKRNQKFIEELRIFVEKHIDKAIKMIFDVVLEKVNP